MNKYNVGDVVCVVSMGYDPCNVRIYEHCTVDSILINESGVKYGIHIPTSRYANGDYLQDVAQEYVHEYYDLALNYIRKQFIKDREYLTDKQQRKMDNLTLDGRGKL